MKSALVSPLLLCAAIGLGMVASPPHSSYRRVDLTSDGSVPAAHVDPNLVNPWGLAFSPTGPFWVADNGTGVSSILQSDGTPMPLIVSLAGGVSSAPTGLVFNGGSGFIVHQEALSGPSVFVFATEEGRLFGWNPAVNATTAVLAFDGTELGAVYKGLALGSTGSERLLYATDFANGRVDVFDHDFARVGSFTDEDVPEDYAPFGIREFDGKLYVTFAVREQGGDDDVPGPGHGLVDVFDTEGHFVRRLVSHGDLNSPWGLAIAPGSFGASGHTLLVGNFGDGRINAYQLQTGNPRGALEDESGSPIEIDGLWALSFGNGHAGGDDRKLYFTAGIDKEAHGLFGSIERVH